MVLEQPTRHQRQRLRTLGTISLWITLSIAVSILYFDYIKRIYEKPGEETWLATYISLAAMGCCFIGIAQFLPYKRRIFHAVVGVIRIIYVMAAAAVAVGDFFILSYFVVPRLHSQKIIEPTELRKRIQNWMPKNPSAGAQTDRMFDEKTEERFWTSGREDVNYILVALTITIGFLAAAQFVLAIVSVIAGCAGMSQCCRRRARDESLDVREELQPVVPGPKAVVVHEENVRLQ